MRPQPYSIRHVRAETDDTFTVELTPVDGTSVMSFAPGQFNMVYVPGCGEIPISISGDPLVQGRLLHTTRAVGSVTNAMRQLAAGDVVGVRGPYGVGWPVDDIAEGKDVTYDMKARRDDPTAASTMRVAEAVAEKLARM